MSENEVLGPEENVIAIPRSVTKLDEIDRMALELAKSQRQVALADAKTALANNEKAELQYKYVVLQLYMKYGLTEKDALNESGDILYGGANVSNG
jgi:hypothetical protein